MGEEQQKREGGGGEREAGEGKVSLTAASTHPARAYIRNELHAEPMG